MIAGDSRAFQPDALAGSSGKAAQHHGRDRLLG
jgi:hypothetical protein